MFHGRVALPGATNPPPAATRIPWNSTTTFAFTLGLIARRYAATGLSVVYLAHW